MKRFLSSVFICVIATTIAFASTTSIYNGTLTAKDRMGGAVVNTTKDDVNVYLTKNDDGTYQIDLKNFIVTTGSSTFYIGNIQVPNMTATVSSGTTTIESKAGSGNNIILSDGDDPAEASWLGNSLGGAKGDVVATISGTKISLAIPVTIQIGLISVTIDVSISGVIRSDVNRDEYVNSVDINTVLTTMTGGEANKNADVNADGYVNSVDINAILSVMTGGNE